MPDATETIVGVFAHVDTTVRALEELRAKGYRDLTVYTPVPVHEIEEVLERDRPVSRVHLFTLIGGLTGRSEEHTSELQSLAYLVCRLLLEKKKNKIYEIVQHQEHEQLIYPHRYRDVHLRTEIVS